jgi:hypothetical protein
MNVHDVIVNTPYTLDHPIPRSIRLYSRTSQARAQDTTTTTKRTLERDNSTPSHYPQRPWTWNVTLKDLTLRPQFHPPLQRTAIIFDDISVRTIAARISQFNKANSMECSYHVSHVQSTTPKLLKFAVHLWASCSDDDENKNNDCDPSAAGTTTTPVIMEVQRLQGCCIQMQSVRKRLIQYVKTGSNDTSTSTSRGGRDHPHRVPSRLLQRIHSCFGHAGGLNTTKNNKEASATRKDKQQKCCIEALSVCLDLLESDKIDQNCLGMESLAIISDRSLVQLGDATRVARSLVYGDEQEGCPRLQDAFQYLFLQSLGETTEHVGYPTACYAMKTLQNSLEIILYSKQEEDEQASGSSGGRPKPIDLSRSFWREIVNDLVRCLEMARNCTQKAALAARCLWLIENLAPPPGGASSSSLSLLLPEYQDLSLLALAACDHGKAFHSSLERESNLLFGIFGVPR